MPEQLPKIFDGLPHNHLLSAMMLFKKMDVAAGTPLIEEGDEDPSLICILDGQVEIKTGGVPLGRAGPGDVIGEMALFGSGVRMASVTSRTEATFMLLDRSGYETLRDNQNPIAKALEEQALAQLGGRLRDTNSRIGKLSQGTTSAYATPNPGILRSVAKLFGGGGGRHRTFGVDAVAVLRKSPLFADAPEAALAEIAKEMTPIACATGTFLCTQGEHSDEMFVLADGLVEVIMALDDEGGRVEQLATCDAGDAFGMAGLVEAAPRMASCVARGKVIALALARREFDALRERADVAGSVLRAALIRGLIDQLAFANGQIAMLDMEEKAKSGTGEFQTRLNKAKSAMEAHGRHLRDEGRR